MSSGRRPLLFVLTRWGGAPKRRVLKHPSVDGVTLRLHWADLEPSSGQYAFESELGTRLAAVRDAGKRARLMVAPGVHAPGWLITPAARQNPPFGVSSTGVALMWARVPNGRWRGEQRWYPVLWDDTYLQAWARFVRALGSWLQATGFAQHVEWISVTGPTGHNGEVSVPKEAPWQPGDVDKLQRAWERCLTTFDAAFGQQGIHYTLAFIFRTFPPALSAGNAGPDWQFKRALVAHGKALPNGQHFGVQTNGLDNRAPVGELPPTKRHWRFVKAFANQGRFNGFQTRAPKKLYAGGTSARARQQVWADLARIVAHYEPAFVEVYARDVEDAARALGA